MNNEIVKINDFDVTVKEFRGKRVVTLKDIDLVHERPEGTARKRFNDNKKHFIEGEDYFVRNSDEAKEEFGIVAPSGLNILTESGYLMLVKSFTDDLAWDVQRKLVKSYFIKKDVYEDISEELKAVLVVDKRITKAETRIEKLEETMNIDYGQQQELKKAVNATVIKVLGGKDSNAYKEIGKKVFSECNRDIQEYFHVNSRNNIPRVKYYEAINYVNTWQPCNNTKIAIKDCNNQLNIA